jgi:TonB family protein
VKTGDFGSTAQAQRPRSKPKVAAESPDTPVEVLSKPTPIYTTEAREQRVEGEVTLRVTFVASGKIEVLEVLQPLGHGLDEAAIDAAKRIRFKPARRDGRPVDHTAVLRIVFQLV